MYSLKNPPGIAGENRKQHIIKNDKQPFTISQIMNKIEYFSILGLDLVFCHYFINIMLCKLRQ